MVCGNNIGEQGVGRLEKKMVSWGSPSECQAGNSYFRQKRVFEWRNMIFPKLEKCRSDSRGSGLYWAVSFEKHLEVQTLKDRSEPVKNSLEMLLALGIGEACSGSL